MKVLESSLKTLIFFLAVTLLITMAVTSAEAIIIDWKTGMVGVTDGQTLRVNVTNVGNPDGFVANIKIFDVTGDIVAEFEGSTLPDGQAIFFDLNRDDIPTSRGRLELRAFVEIDDSNERNRNRLRSTVRVTVEVFDNVSGKTEVFVGNPDGFN